MENLQNKKKEIIEQIGIEGLKQLKFSKILKLLKSEIKELISYWTIKQVHQMVNEVFNINISSPFFYRFCQQNLKTKKDEKLESVKPGKIKNLNISQNKNIKKKSILSEDELNAIAMFGSGSSSKNQLKD
jgi:hypothetical protein